MVVLLASAVNESNWTVTLLDAQALGNGAGDIRSGFVTLLDPPEHWLPIGVKWSIGEMQIITVWKELPCQFDMSR